MSINTNAWNKIRYTVYAPFYNFIGRLFTNSRRQSIEKLNLKENEKVLLVGAGTGLDLEFLTGKQNITATDLTPAMVEKIKIKSKKLGLNSDVEVMDGHQLAYKNNTFDAVILHLVLAVIPDPVRCLKEAERVLTSGGRIAVFDKFIPSGQLLTFRRKILNKVANTLFSDINRNFEDIRAQTNLEVISDVNADFGLNYRIIILQKPLR